MSTSVDAISPATKIRFGGEFWERLWRASGVIFVACFLVIALIYGYQPAVGAHSESLLAFYGGERARVLIASVLTSLNVLNLMWFAAALRAALADAGQGGWGAAASAASAAFGALLVFSGAVSAALAYSIAQPGGEAMTATLNSLSWALAVLISFPRAMLTMSGAFGLWRARQIPNGLFAVGVAAVVIGVLGGTTWLDGGVWSPDGVFSRFVSPIVFLAWTLVVSRVLLTGGASKAGW